MFENHVFTDTHSSTPGVYSPPEAPQIKVVRGSEGITEGKGENVYTYCYNWIEFQFSACEYKQIYGVTLPHLPPLPAFQGTRSGAPLADVSDKTKRRY